MIPKKNYLLLFVFVLTGCSTTAEKPKIQLDCSCNGYFPLNNSRPNWVDTEGLNKDVYYSHGVAECTGLKSIDTQEASTVARANLANMLESNVQNETLLIRQSDSATRSGSEKGKVTTTIMSQSLMKNSVIYAYWQDPNSCTIYSAVKLSKKDIADALKSEQKIKNQLFMVKAEGDFTKQIELTLIQSLNEHGVTKISKKESNQGYLLKGEISSINLFKDKKLVRLSLALSIINNNQNLVWTQQAHGKSISFDAFNENYLIKEALKNALTTVSLKLEKILNQKLN